MVVEFDDVIVCNVVELFDPVVSVAEAAFDDVD